MVIVSALAAEYSGVLSISPAQMLLAFCVNLKTYSRWFIHFDVDLTLNLAVAVVQDACIAAMLRIAADCDGVIAEKVISSVSEVRQNAGRHIQRVYPSFSGHP